MLASALWELNGENKMRLSKRREEVWIGSGGSSGSLSPAPKAQGALPGGAASAPGPRGMTVGEALGNGAFFVGCWLCVLCFRQHVRG